MGRNMLRPLLAFIPEGENMINNDEYDVIIVGGGPGGLSAALYAARARLKTLVVEEKRKPGGQCATTSELENYPGIIKDSGPALMEKFTEHARHFGAEFLQGRVLSLAMSPDGLHKRLKLKDGTTLATKSVIIATGTRPRILGIPGEKEFAGRGVSYCATCDADFYTELDVVVVGSGNTAVEESIFLTRYVNSVTMVVKHGFADELLPSVRVMARIESKRTGDFLHMPETIKGMITPPQGAANIAGNEQKRINGISEVFSLFGSRYDGIKMACLEDASCTPEMAREKLLNELGRESTPSNKNIPTHIYAGNGNFVGDGIRQALMARAGFEKTERDNVYNGMTLREYARMSLTERGIGVSSYNPMQMVGAAFTHSTSDFGNILLDVANKAILQGWEDAPETYEQWTRKGQLSDFKIAHRVGMGGFSALRQVREGAEYKYVTTGDKQATIALATYGELFSITRQAIINDDLNMLTDVPMKLGRAAKSTIADLVYAILTSNPKISTDNVSLFDKAKHANVLESAAMDVASLDKARQLMRVQKEGERHLNIRPAFVLVPTAMESVANQVIRSSSVKGADINAGIINPVKDFATVIAEPRLDDNSQTTFYLAASKGSDTIEVAYLNGVDTPYIDQMEGFSVDGVTTKVRIDAGVAPVDHRGLVKCTA